MDHTELTAATNAGVAAFSQSELTLIDEYARHLLGVYSGAGEEAHNTGDAWYAGVARQLAYDVAQKAGISVAVAAAVIAVCSPSTRWSQQVRNTAPFVRWVLDGGTDLNTAPRASLYMKNMQKAAHILLTGDTSVVCGPKVLPFMWNILGDHTLVTLDVWAIRAVLGSLTENEAKNWGRGRRRNVLEAAYHRAANWAGASVAAFQAVVWGVVRGAYI